jgi:zinc transport system ATP-binding protein
MNVVELNNVSYAYTKDTSVVEQVSFAVPENSTTMIIGPNGSGKTTVLKLMLGLLKPKQGSIEVLNTAPKSARKDVGYVPQRLTFDTSFPLTVAEFLKLPKNVSTEELNEVLKSVGMQDAADQLIGMLSGGQLQRVLIARSLMNRPKILFLDEPTSGIDVQGEQHFYELIAQLKEKYSMTVVMVSHDIHHVSKYANQVICINKGMLCCGNPTEALSSDMMRELYGKHMVPYEHNH